MNNEIRSNLNKIVNQYGHYIYNEPNRCESLIRDYCNDDKKARNLLITALKEKIPERLMTSKNNAEIKLKLGQLAQKLEEETGITKENAQWTVETWAIALNLIPNPEIKQTLSNSNKSDKQENVVNNASSKTKTSTQKRKKNQPKSHHHFSGQQQHKTQSQSYKLSSPQRLKKHTPPTKNKQPKQPLTLVKPVYSYSPSPPSPNNFHSVRLEYPNFLIRVLASLGDLMILNSLTLFFFFLTEESIFQQGPAEIIGYFIGLNIVIFFSFGWIYSAVMESSPFQATLGKLVFGIIVTNLQGRKISFARASARHYSKFLSLIIFGFGFLYSLFNYQKQTLHDKITQCLVIKK